MLQFSVDLLFNQLFVFQTGRQK